MPRCCNKTHVGWICPICGVAMAIRTHMGNEPVSVKKIENVTIVQGDLIQGSVIKDSVVMGNVASEETTGTVVSDSGEKASVDIIEDSIVLDSIQQLTFEDQETKIDLSSIPSTEVANDPSDSFDI